MIWFGWVLWHINHCRSFNAKSGLFIYITYDKKLNSFKYCYISLTSVICLTQLNDQTVLFPRIQFSVSNLFAHSLNVKQFYLTHRLDSFRCYHFGPKWTWEPWQWKGTPHSPKFQHYWSLTIRLFSVTSRKPSRLGYNRFI